jgi:hypothetical protein
MKKPVYCGTSDEIPKKYSRAGTPYECLRKGIGVGIMTSTEEKKVQMIKKMMDKPLKKETLVMVAMSLSVNIYNDNNKVIKKDEIIKKIMNKLKKQK